MKEKIKLSESQVQHAIQQIESAKGNVLWRNNVGCLQSKDNRTVRYGLANTSAKENAYIKSSDLIGIKKVKITQEMVGKTIGQFYCREVKKSGWKYSGSDREQAQLRFIELVRSKGGDADFQCHV